MITTKLEKQKLCASPESDEALFSYIERLSGSERALAYTVSGMTWNRAVDKLSEIDFESVDVEVNSTDALWVTVGNISVRICRSDEGAVCDMYTLGAESLDDAHLASCYAFFQEAEEFEEEEDAITGHPI